MNFVSNFMEGENMNERKQNKYKKYKRKREGVV
jgi:hypothetical protein